MKRVITADEPGAQDLEIFLDDERVPYAREVDLDEGTVTAYSHPVTGQTERLRGVITVRVRPHCTNPRAHALVARLWQ